MNKLIIISTILLFTCNTKKGVNYSIDDLDLSQTKPSFIISDTLRIGLDSITAPHHYYDQIKIINNEAYYILLNSNNSSIQAYSINSSKKFKLKFEEEGNNGIGNPDRFYYHNADSIFFIYYDNIKKIVLANSMGVVTKRWNLKFPEPYSDYWISGELFYDFKYNSKNKSLGFWISKGNVDTKKFQNTILNTQFNIYTGEYKFFGHLPNLYSESILYPNYYLNALATDQYLINYFLPTPEIQIYNLDHGELERAINLKSSHFNNSFTPFITKDGQKKDSQQENNYNIENGFFVKMLTNEDATFFYRICKLPSELRNSSGKIRHFHDKPFSIQILDKDFKLILEPRFDGGKFDFFQCFAFEDKLYLSLNNPMNNLYNEDELLFAVFSITNTE